MIAPCSNRWRRHGLLARLLALAFAGMVAILGLGGPVAAFDPWWVATHSDAELWSGPDAHAVSFGPVPKGSAFLVVAPQQGSRLQVQDPRTGGLAFIDAAATGPGSPARIPPSRVAPPSGPSGVKRALPAVPQGFQPFWVANWLETEFWSGPESWAHSHGATPQFRKFLVIEPQKGDRLKVWSPETEVIGYLDVAAAGPVGPSVWLEPRPLRISGKVGLPGRSIGARAYVRNLPTVADETELRHAANNTPLTLLEKGVAADGTEWYTAGNGQYIRAAEVRLPTPPPAHREGRWIDVDLSEPAMVTAYEGKQVVYTALAIIGKDATPTLRGEFRILRRVEDETMDSSTLGIPREDPDGYFLEDVLYTQYFTWQGAAIHYNWWLGTFGQEGSHGCLGLNLADSEWFWNWASVGTPVIIR